jgi:hypothetical protein
MRLAGSLTSPATISKVGHKPLKDRPGFIAAAIASALLDTSASDRRCRAANTDVDGGRARDLRPARL